MQAAGAEVIAAVGAEATAAGAEAMAVGEKVSSRVQLQQVYHIVIVPV